MMISDALKLPDRSYESNELFLFKFPPELLEFFIKNQLSISTPVKTRYVYEGFTPSQEYYVPISDIFMIPPPNDSHSEREIEVKKYKGLQTLLHQNPKVRVKYTFPRVTGKEQVNMLISKYKQALGEDAINNSEH